MTTKYTQEQLERIICEYGSAYEPLSHRLATALLDARAVVSKMERTLHQVSDELAEAKACGKSAHESSEAWFAEVQRLRAVIAKAREWATGEQAVQNQWARREVRIILDSTPAPTTSDDAFEIVEREVVLWVGDTQEHVCSPELASGIELARATVRFRVPRKPKLSLAERLRAWGKDVPNQRSSDQFADLAAEVAALEAAAKKK
jgi:hypothetical protein